VCFGGDFVVLEEDGFLGGVEGLPDTTVLH